MINKIRIECNKWGTNTFITKPQPGGFGIGFKKWNLDKVLKSDKGFTNYKKKIEKQVRIEKPLLLCILLVKLVRFVIIVRLTVQCSFFYYYH